MTEAGGAIASASAAAVLDGMAADPTPACQHYALVVDVVGFSQKSTALQMDCFRALRSEIARELPTLDALARDATVLCAGDGFVVVASGDQAAVDLVRLGLILLGHSSEQNGWAYALTCGLAVGRGARVPSLLGRQFIGDTVNMATRVQSLALPGQLLIMSAYIAGVLDVNQPFAELGVAGDDLGELRVKHRLYVGVHTVHGGGVGLDRVADARQRPYLKPESLIPRMLGAAQEADERPADLAEAVAALYPVVLRSHGGDCDVRSLLTAKLDSIAATAARATPRAERQYSIELELAALQGQLGQSECDKLYLAALRFFATQLLVGPRQGDDDERD